MMLKVNFSCKSDRPSLPSFWSKTYLAICLNFLVVCILVEVGMDSRTHPSFGYQEYQEYQEGWVSMDNQDVSRARSNQLLVVPGSLAASLFLDRYMEVLL